MKNYCLLFLLTLIGYCVDISAQCSENCKHCTDKKAGQAIKNKGMTTQVTNKPMTCKLTSPELRKRKEEVIAKLKQQVLGKRELADGFAYRFDGTDELLDSLTAFIKSERMCCDFFNFKILVLSDATVWLEITGAKGAKEFIKTELEM